jgi:catechol 2,3-dioxygenase-like lactoylglutathione lyase family enzyme
VYVSREPELAELAIGDEPEAWRALGFHVDEGNLDLGGIRIRLGVEDQEGGGILSWSLRGVNAMGSIDGLPSPVPRVLRPPPFATHPNGATGLDHVVISTSDFDRTADAFRRAGMPLKRTRENGQLRQGFRRLGSAIVELVYSPQLDGRHTGFWGLTVVVISLEDLAERLGDRLGEIKPAVQRGRRIATLQPTEGVSPRVAFMSPEPP